VAKQEKVLTSKACKGLKQARRAKRKKGGRTCSGKAKAIARRKRVLRDGRRANWGGKSASVPETLNEGANRTHSEKVRVKE